MTQERPLFPEERQEGILRQLTEEGRVSVNELGQRYGVSAVTIRTDLQELESLGKVKRTYGGAVLPPRNDDWLSLTLRRQQQEQEKEAIAEAAAGFIQDGDALFIDSSSTNLALVRRLRNFRDLTVVSNSLAVAQTLQDVPAVTVVLIGGELRRDTLSLTGSNGLGILNQYNLRSGFFGAHGITLAEGLTDVSAAEAELKRGLVKRCKQVIVVLDRTKWGRVGAASFAGIEDLDFIISDTGAPESVMDDISGIRPRIMLVKTKKE